MDLPPKACTKCQGIGKVRVPIQRPWWLAWLPPTRQEKCGACHGSGTIPRSPKEIADLRSIVDKVPVKDLLRFYDAFLSVKRDLAREWSPTVLNAKAFEHLCRSSNWSQWDDDRKWGSRPAEGDKSELERRFGYDAARSGLENVKKQNDEVGRFEWRGKCGPIERLDPGLGSIVVEEAVNAILERRKATKAERVRRESARPANKQRAAALNLPTVQHSIASAVNQNLLIAEVTGSGLKFLTLLLDSTTERPLRVMVPCGTVFHPEDKEKQNMVNVEDVEIALDAFDKKSIYLRAACANMHLEVPTSEDALKVGSFIEHRRLRQLLGSTAFQSCDWVTQQFAVWTSTDNPSPNEMIAIREGLEHKHLCDSEMVATLADMFRKADIPTSEYRLFREKKPSA